MGWGGQSQRYAPEQQTWIQVPYNPSFPRGSPVPARRKSASLWTRESLFLPSLLIYEASYLLFCASVSPSAEEMKEDEPEGLSDVEDCVLSDHWFSHILSSDPGDTQTSANAPHGHSLQR